MKINSVLLSAYTTKPSREQTYVEKHKHVTQDFSNAKNTALMSYSANYYVSFKGEEKSDAIKNYEAFLDDLYENNKGTETKYVNNYRHFIPDTMSRLMQSQFDDMIKEVLFYHRAPIINEEKLEKVLSKTLKKYHAKETAQECIRSYKEQNHIKAELLIDDDEHKISTLTAMIARNLKLPKHGPVSMKHFWNDFYDELIKSNPRMFDEKCLKRMKEALNEEPFKSFNEKMLKIRAQELANSSYPSQQCAQDIYKDSIEKKIPPFENKKLYDYVSKNNEKLDFLLEKIYGFGVKQYTGIFDNSSIDQKHKVLLVDPCVAAHLGELVDFVNKENIDTKNIEPFELRQKFSKYLGTETVYRGLHSDSPEDCAKAVKKDGNYSSVYKDEKDAINAIKYYLDVQDEWSNTVNGRISDKIRNPSDNNEFLSVSSEYDIAASVMKLRGQPESPVVVMKVNIPRISLIKQENSFSDMQWNSRHKELCVGYRRFDYDRDQARIEAFVPFCFTPDAIEEVVIDTHTPNFYWL